jgi:hydrogenase maturation protein HypF
VRNSSQGVFVEADGSEDNLMDFLRRLEAEKPARAYIQSLESSFLDAAGFARFEILSSDPSEEKIAFILPDIACCPDCLREISDPADRRYRYPFTNCTNCGPRFSIIQSLPYDRPHTTMNAFEMCPACRAEYENPCDRRFHAQPNACPACGPHLELWDEFGQVLAEHEAALQGAVASIRDGKIVAVKGLGGFHLMADARQESVVTRLRQRKHREEKPLALMVPSLEVIREMCMGTPLEERALQSPESPIVLLRRRTDDDRMAIAPGVAPRNPNLAVMLPYTPLHHLLMRELGFPVVATSGNLSDEPICTDEREGLLRLAGIADVFLVHNRPIARHVDDSIVRIVCGRETVLRRARGFAPLPIHQEKPMPPLLAVGAHLKNTVAISVGNEIFVSQHIGDLETVQAADAFARAAEDLQQLYELQPQAIACDLHPDYWSTRFAQQRGAPLVRVQHHYAHVLACMAENEQTGPVLGVSWDGTGYGSDGTVWGGEFLIATPQSFSRAAHFRVFPLPGGEKAIKEPRRTALGLLYQLLGKDVFLRNDLPLLSAFTASELASLQTMLDRNINSPKTSSAGRLFDAVAALVGLQQVSRFEGQAAMELEFALTGVETEETYSPPASRCVEEKRSSAPQERPLVLDWGPLILQVLEDGRSHTPAGVISARFHNALATSILEVARAVGIKRVVLTGGCFQNRYLTERAIHLLRRQGFLPYWHQRIPPNDGGIALGQIIAAANQTGKG